MKKLFLTFTIILAFAATTFAQVIPEGVYVIKFAGNPNYVLTLKDGKAKEGNDVVLYERNNSKAQKWKVEHTGMEELRGKNIIISSRANPKYVITAPDNETKEGARIVVENYEWACGFWTPEDLGNGTCLLKCMSASLLCLGVVNGNENAKNNGQVQVSKVHKGYEQQWIFEKVDD